jgi:hypothetical protein
MFSDETLEINRKKILKKYRRDQLKKKTPLVGAAFTVADADADAAMPSP